MLRSSIVVLAMAALLCPAAALQGTSTGPRDGELDKLVAEYLALDARSAAGLARQDAILAQLAELPPLDAAAAKSWRAKIAKLWSKGPELEAKSGQHFLWEKEERGRYIVGGDRKKPKGLLVCMHGGGEGSGDASSAHAGFEPALGKTGWLAIYPEVLRKTEHGWTDSGTEEFVLELVDRAVRTFGVPRDRIYFGGHSMGGYGTWTLGAHHADVVAGLVPSAGAPTPILDRETNRPIDIVPGVIPNLRNVSMVIYQSDDDPRVPPDANRLAVELLGKAREKWGGYEHEYWEEAARGHDEPPGGFRALIGKIRARERQPRPAKVVWQPVLPWKRHFYWLWWSKPRAEALVVAEVNTAANTVAVTGDGDLAGLSVLLDDALVDLDREVVVTVDGAEVFRGKPERSLAAVLASGARGDPSLTFDAWVPLRR